MKFILPILIILVFNSCTNKKDKITGNWIRTDDVNRGMIISVTKVGQGYEGKIIARPSNYSIFDIGDLKWKNLVEKSKDYYQYEDLFKDIGSSRYRESYLNIINDTIKTRVFSKNYSSGGEEQVWVKTDSLTLTKN